MKKTFIIAEAGVNHNGEIDLAHELIEKAYEAKVDAVKFQTFISEESLSKNCPNADYQVNQLGISEGQLEMCKKLELKEKDFFELKSHAEQLGLEFMTTAFDLPSTEVLARLKVKKIKVPSGDITNLPLLEKLGSFNLQTYLSTGMSSLKEVKEAAQVLVDSGLSREKLTVLHCNTEYPTPFSDINLLAMRQLGHDLNLPFGYSDHSLGIEVPIAAVALGATVIEKHFTLDTSMVGPDHAASLNPKMLIAMVECIRNIDLALGSNVKKPSNSEEKNILLVRRSLVARRPIKKGDILTLENVGIKRPGHGISPMRWHEIENTFASKDFEIDDFIEL